MNTPLLASEEIIKKGPANLQRGIETVGGNLYLTNQRLVFEPHVINIQAAAEAIDLKQITGMEFAMTKFLGIFPIISNTLSVKLGDEARNFVLYGRGKWRDAILAKKAEL